MALMVQAVATLQIEVAVVELVLQAVPVSQVAPVS
jgi:hypothetical protein